jgi:hypothetical protein
MPLEGLSESRRGIGISHPVEPVWHQSIGVASPILILPHKVRGVQVHLGFIAQDLERSGKFILNSWELRQRATALRVRDTFEAAASRLWSGK